MDMKRMKGPTKRLAPVIAPDIACPHSFSDDEGIQLEVDCSECHGAHDLQNSKCLIGIVNVLSAGAQPDAIILKRFTHKRYRGEEVRIVALAAAELSSLNRALAVTEPSSDKRCRTCTASAEHVVNHLKRELAGNPFHYISTFGSIAAEIESAAEATTCASACACVASGLSASSLNRGRC